MKIILLLLITSAAISQSDSIFLSKQLHMANNTITFQRGQLDQCELKLADKTRQLLIRQDVIQKNELLLINSEATSKRQKNYKWIAIITALLTTSALGYTLSK